MAEEFMQKKADIAEYNDYDRIRTKTDVLLEEAAKAIEEQNDKNQKSEQDIFADNMSSFKSGLRYAAKYLKSRKNELIVGFLFILIAVMSLYRGYELVQRFLYLHVSKGINEPILALLAGILPFVLWGWSTKYAFYNFYKIKRLTFRLCVANAVLQMWYIILNVEIKLIMPFILLIPTYGGISYTTVILSAYMFLLAIYAVPFIVVMYRYYMIVKDDMTDRWMIGFYAKNYLPDTRKNKKYAYDMRCIKRMNSFSKTQVIYQNDRFLHVAGVGATGTGKTAAIGTVVFEGDLQQKVFNTDYQKKLVEKWLEEGKAKLTRNFEDIDFNIDYISGAGKYEDEINRELEKLKIMSASAGVTVFCPNQRYSDQLYKIAKAKGFRVNRVDPMPDKNTKSMKTEFIGFNPLYVPPETDKYDYLDKVFTAAKLYADVNQAVFELAGSGNPYFTSLNQSITISTSVCMIITYPHVHPGKYATPGEVQDVINNFERIKPYRDKLVELYGEKNEYGNTIMDVGNARVIPELQFILARIDRDMLGANAPEISKQATGLRNIIDNSLTDTRIRRILCSQETIDMDKALEKGEITLVNFEISLGSASNGFGMFFLLSFIQAVLRREGTEDTRIPHFLSVDESPWLLHPKIETALTLFRQYRCSTTLFLQGLTQLDKNSTTKYLKLVLIGNCATQVYFGRSSYEEMQMVKNLAGKKQEVEESTSIRETALSDENTQMASSTSYAVKETDRYDETDVRYRQFLECTVMTVRDSTPLVPFIGKVNFLSRHKEEPVKRYVVDWSKYYTEPEKESNLKVSVMASTSVRAAAQGVEISKKTEPEGISVKSVEAVTNVNTKPVKEVKKVEEKKVEELPTSVRKCPLPAISAEETQEETTTEEPPGSSELHDGLHPVLDAITEFEELPAEETEDKPKGEDSSDDSVFIFE